MSMRKHSSLVFVGLAAALLFACDSGSGGDGGGGGDFNDIVGGGTGGDGVIGGGGTGDDGGNGGTGGTGGSGGTGDATGGGGGVGDLDAVDTAEGSIKALQVEAEQTGCDSTAIQDLRTDASVSGVIITSPRFEAAAGLHAYYAADGDQAEWSGVMVTVPDSEGTNWQIGDVVDLTGTLQEAWCNTQLRVDAGGWAAGAPTTPVAPLEVGGVGSWEPYEGMLIKVSGVTVEAEAGAGRYTISGGLEVDHDFDFFLSLDVGETYDIVGQVKYSFDQYKLMPRSEDDIVMVAGGGGDDMDTIGGGGDDDTPGGGGGDAGPIEDVPTGAPGTVLQLQTEAYATGCDPGNIQDLAGGKTIDEAVVASPAFEVTGQLTGYYVTDPFPAQWAGIMVTVPTDAGTNWQPGDRFSLTGSLQEAWCNTQLAVQPGGWTALDPASTEAPAPLVIADAGDVDDWEPWEGTFVRVTSELVAEALGGGRYLLASGLVVDHDFDFFLELEVGSTYDIEGSIKYSFDQFRLMPHNEDQIGMVGGGGGDMDTVDPVDDDATTGGDDAGPSDDDASAPVGNPNTTITELQGGADSADCTMDETPQELTDGLVLDGAIAVAPFEVSFSLDGIVLTDGTQDPYSAVLVVFDKDAFGALPVGAQVRVAGQHAEFYCNTQIVATSINVMSLDVNVPAPLVLGESELTALEPYEGMVVEVQNVTVTSVSEIEDYGQVAIDAGGLLVDDEVLSADELWETVPEVGAEWQYVRGVITYSFGAYRINPRSLDDLMPAGTDVP